MSVGLHPDNPDIHVLAPEKGNYKKDGGRSYGFRIEPRDVVFGDGTIFDLGCVVPIGPVDVTADDLSLAAARTSKERSAVNEARNAILQALIGGPLLVLDLLGRVKKDGHAEKTFEVARRTLHEEKFINRAGGGRSGPVSWFLTDRGRTAAMKVAREDEIAVDAAQDASRAPSVPLGASGETPEGQGKGNSSDAAGSASDCSGLEGAKSHPDFRNLSYSEIMERNRLDRLRAMSAEDEVEELPLS
jgi:hypothetical protein